MCAPLPCIVKSWKLHNTVLRKEGALKTVFMQSMTKSGRFDFIKLDVEGEEKQLLKDPSSHAVLCEALCIFMELHERFEPGCVEAFRLFLRVRPPALDPLLTCCSVLRALCSNTVD